MNLQMRQLNKMRLELEGCRKNLGKGKIFTAMKEKMDAEPQQMMTKEELARIFVKSNIKKEDVVGIKFNEYRKGQVEFLLADGVTVDVKKMEEAIEDEDMKINLGAFDHVEEVMMIFGLPLTKEVGNMKEKIEEAILPFVQTIISTTPCTYSEGGDFFKGKRNGNWRVVVEPKKLRGVPNFIVVGNQEKAQGQVNYVKSFSMRPEMCADCFQEGHLKMDRQCPGIRPWREYCGEFQRKWEEALVDVCVGLEEEGAGPGVPVSRLEEMQKELRDLKKNNRRMEEQLLEVDKGKEIGEKKQKEIEELMNKNREGMEERKKIEVEMKKQEESRMELINIIERGEREKQMRANQVEELKIEMERMRTEMLKKDTEKEILARSLGEQHRLGELLEDLEDDGIEDVEMSEEKDAENQEHVIINGEESEGGRETVLMLAGRVLTGASNVEEVTPVEIISDPGGTEQEKVEGLLDGKNGSQVAGIPATIVGSQEGLSTDGGEDTEGGDTNSKRPRESPGVGMSTIKKTKSEDINAKEMKDEGDGDTVVMNDDSVVKSDDTVVKNNEQKDKKDEGGDGMAVKNMAVTNNEEKERKDKGGEGPVVKINDEQKKLPEKDHEVWIEENGKKTNWVVKSKKDNSKGGGCFNCKGLENGENRNINFNTAKWGFLKTFSDISNTAVKQMSDISDMAVNLKVDAEGRGLVKTPPTIPPRVPTPPHGVFPPREPPVNRTVKHF